MPPRRIPTQVSQSVFLAWMFLHGWGLLPSSVQVGKFSAGVINPDDLGRNMAVIVQLD